MRVTCNKVETSRGDILNAFATARCPNCNILMASGKGIVGIKLTVLYTELEADEPPEQEEEAQEGPQDEAREELAGT